MQNLRGKSTGQDERWAPRPVHHPEAEKDSMCFSHLLSQLVHLSFLNLVLISHSAKENKFRNTTCLGEEGEKKICQSFLSEMFWESNFYQREKNPTQDSKQETLISLPGSSIALWKCYPTVIATFSSCLWVIYGFKMGVNLPCKQGRGPKAGRSSGRNRGWRGNTKEQDLYYLTTYIYNDKIFIVFYGKLWSCFCSVFGSGKSKPVSSKNAQA